MKKDLIVASVLFLMVLSCGIWVKSYNNSYSAKIDPEDEIQLADYIDRINEIHKDLKEEKEKQNKVYETDKTLEEVYLSIFNTNEGEIKVIDKDMNDIYVNFYEYFSKDDLFYNMYKESYTYDEYMFLKEHHLMRNNDEMFGMYLITYTKCEVFGLVDVDTYKDNLIEYCENL